MGCAGRIEGHQQRADCASLEGIIARFCGGPRPLVRWAQLDWRANCCRSIVTEEGPGFPRRGAGNDCYLPLDPLDGTREFLAGRNEFAVNMLLWSADGRRLDSSLHPLWDWSGAASSVAAPKAASLGATNGGCTAQPRKPARAGVVAAVSRSHLGAHTEEFLQRLEVTARVPSGSSLKFCRIAEGVIDIIRGCHGHVSGTLRLARQS